jgi:HK97 family phage major capsid protein
MASELAKRLNDQRNRMWDQCKEITERALEENRSELTAEEHGKFEGLNEQIDNLDKRIKEILDAEQRNADADAVFNRLGAKPKESQYAGAPGMSGRTANSELRALVRREQGAPEFIELRPSEQTQHLMSMGRINELRTLSTLTTGAGGNLAPTDFYDQLIAHLIEVSGIMQAGPTVINTAGGETLQIPKTTAHSAAASAAQAGTIPSSDPTFGLVTLSAYKYGIIIQVARELIDDSGVDLLGYLAMQCGRAIGNKFGSDLVTGTGGGVQPNGLMNLATVGVTGTTTGKTGAPQYADLVNLEYSVIAPYRMSKSCYWIAADKTIGGFRLLVDANSRPIWEPSVALGSPDLLLGKPIVADPFMPAVATGAKSVAFGDMAQFFVRLVGGVRFERSDDFLFNQDLVAFRALLRGDGTLVDQTGAVKLFQGPTT